MLSPPSTLLDMDAEHLQEWHFSLQLRPRVGRHPAGLALRRYTRAYALALTLNYVCPGIAMGMTRMPTPKLQVFLP